MANEKRLIDANVALLNTYNQPYWTESESAAMRCFLVEQPTVDAAPVVHGWWEPELMPTGVEYSGYQEMTVQALSCSVCGKCIDVSEGYFSHCPNCGAKMDLKEE